MDKEFELEEKIIKVTEKIMSGEFDKEDFYLAMLTDNGKVSSIIQGGLKAMCECFITIFKDNNDFYETLKGIIEGYEVGRKEVKKIKPTDIN
jgi:hypothetical protein